MGLTNQVRDFFTNRIKEALKEKQDAVETKIRTGVNIRKEAVAVLDKEYPQFDVLNKLQEYSELKKQEDALDKKMEIANVELRDILQALGGYCYSSSRAESITEIAEKKYKDAIIKERFPEEWAQIQTIKNAERDVEGAILLATTEQKLIATLTKVLERYGASLGDLKDVVGLE